MSGRVVRIFLSSTFRDFGEERDLLVRKVFPTLRARLQSRFVDLVDVDLRWGITEEEAEHGEVLPICLAEIDRARPYFIGFLGERYGWVPPPDAYPSHVLESQTWLEEHRGGKSVTELEILHGVLNNPHMEGRALFYFRSFEYSSSKGGDYISSSPDDEIRQSTLKQTIRQSGFPVYENYKSPEHLAELLEKDLWEILDREFPASDIPDAFVRENLQHEAYALPRQRLYIGGDNYLTALDKALSEGKQSILVDGPSGGGKSALLANWLKSVRERYSNMEVHAHYLGATANATDPVFMVRRLIECIKRKTESTEDLASDPDELLDSLPTWLANASSWCELRDKKFLFVIDALNSLSDRRDLRWFPRMLPKHIHLVISTLPGEVDDALQERANWSHVTVMPLDATTAELVFTSYLSLFNKTLPDELVEQVMSHKLSANPLFLLTLAEELRLFGEHEQLSNRLDHYLTSITVDDLFERVLERIEQDYGADMLREIMTAFWAARSGLREEEILGYSGLKPMHWAYIRNALGPTLIDASGRLIFAHDYMRIAVSDRYMAGNNTIGNEGQSEEALNLRRSAHTKLANWFEKYAFQDGQSTVSNERAAEEIPYQLQKAQEWKKLQTALTGQEMFVAILETLGKQELFSYWLLLEANIKTDVELQYKKSWAKWGLNENDEATGYLAQILGYFLDYGGRYTDFVERLLLLHFTLTENNLGPEHPDSVTALDGVAVAISKRDIERAEPLYRRALQIRQKVLGLEHLDTATSLDALAVCLWEKGDYSGAEPLYRRALQIREKVLGPEHPDTATSIDGLALVHRTKGDYEGAEQLYRRALAIREKALGPEHLDTATSLNYLSILLHKRGDYGGAETLDKRVIGIREKFYGPEHPLTAESLNNLAFTLYEKSDYERAEQLFRRAVQIREKVLGPEHPHTAISIDGLALVHRTKGDYDRAELLHSRAFEIRNKVFGPEHPDTANSLSLLANICTDKGDYEQAKFLHIRALKIREQVFGPEHDLTVESLENIFLNFWDLGDWEAAHPLYKRVLNLRLTLFGPEHSLTIKSLSFFDYCFANKNDTDQAELLVKGALELLENSLGSNQLEMADHLTRIATLLGERGHQHGAHLLYKRALDIREKELGQEHPDSLIALHQFGLHLRLQGQTVESSELLGEALDVFQIVIEGFGNLFGEGSLMQSFPMLALGKTHLLLQNFEAAEKCYTHTLQIRKSQCKPEDPDLMEVYKFLDELNAAKKS